MFKFEIGSSVIVKKNPKLDSRNYGTKGLYCNPEMLEYYGGGVFIIEKRKVEPSYGECYYLSGPRSGIGQWVWQEDWLEPIVKKKLMLKDMLK